MVVGAEVLREHGLQVTPQRLAVLQAVQSQPHTTAEAVADTAREQIGSISKQSVYDALAALVDAGIIRRIEPAGSAARYETRVGDNHHHLVCRGCGAIIDVDCVVGAAPCLTAADAAGYTVDEAEVTFWGTCPTCASSAPS
ncbi:MAG: Fur family transcriptional regulator [Candidatus Nanopelagicales bacterium]|jgi:Fe2+ or Zn2+ uptake regulation protein